jgi:peptidase S41-like protein
MTELHDELAAETLPDFLDTHEVGTLSIDDRRLIVEQALLLLEQNYALLSFKAARYGVNPVQRLRLMQTRLGRPDEPEPEWRFHAELVDIFNSLRDLHTRYRLPQPFNTAVARLPFLLKEFTEDNRRRYLVGRVMPNQPELDADFRFGVEVTHWNGVPIARAVERFAERFPGANPDARHSRAVERFTVRSMAFGPPPDEDWITVRYVDGTDTTREISFVWDVQSFVPAAAEGAEPDAVTEPLGVDVEGAQLARLRTLLFAPEFLVAERSGEPVATGSDGVDVTAAFSTVFEARKVSAGGREFGHLRLRTFLLPPLTDIPGFVGEFIRLLGELPADGLVVDIRGNGGGAIFASELCLQALTARPFEPEPAQFAVTPLNLRICRAGDAMKPWRPSMEQGLDSGAAYSAAVPFTQPEWLAQVPQSYFGPVVLLTDARCYSAADIFAAGFQDNRIGLVLGVDRNTGAGGGNVWELKKNMLGLLPADESPFKPLPNGAELSIVIRRLLRVGEAAGAPLEDYGVVPNEHHDLTRNDILNDEADLMAKAAELLDKGAARRFDVELSEAGGELTATFQVLGIDRADISADGRPRLTVDLGGNPGPVPVPGAETADVVRIVGFDGPDLVAVRTFDRKNGSLQLRTTFEL